MDSDDQEVFEIVDFTTASEWERFIAAVEEALHEWCLIGERSLPNLTKGELATAKWTEKTVTVKFADFPFNMTYHSVINESIESPPEESEPSIDIDDEDEAEKLPQALADMMDRENDFPARAHCLVRWYGLREFITLAPINVHQPITCPSKSKLLLSSLTIAANNTSCQVPLYVQVLAANEKMYLGIGWGAGVRTDYNMVHQKRPPNQCSHLAGLLDIFKSKLQCGVSSPPVMVSVRFTYVLSDWPHTLWTQQPPDFDATLTEVGFSDLGNLPFGALSDPVSELHVSATWPGVSEDVLVDSDVYSDLDPGSAPLWTARLVTAASPPCLLSEYLTEFLHICRDNRSISKILGPDYSPENEDVPDISHALDRLTEDRVPTISKIIGRGRSSRKPRSSRGGDGSPIPEDILIPMLNYMFPDAVNNDQQTPYASNFTQVPEWMRDDEETQQHTLKTHLSNMKSSGADGLVWRLGILMSQIIHSLGGLRAAAHFWYEIVMELRYRWDNCIMIPGVGSGHPDLASTLLHQKLQMLNCCIKRRKALESFADKAAKTNDEEETDEFYECEEEMEDDEQARGRMEWDKPEGRLKRHGNMRLLNTSEHLFVPITQEAAPMTEDRLEEQSEVLLRLGTDAVGSQLRARMMSASLLSDMESFKAANPGAILEDFVRWYSPRDWIEDEEAESGSPKGNLSSRMLLPGNMWQEVWSSAKPVPARRQKRLFDDTREAEQVLHWLGQMGPGKACSLLQPTIIHAALCRLSQEKLLFCLPAPNIAVLPQAQHSNTLATVLDIIAQRAVRLSRQPPQVEKYRELVDQVTEIEVSVAVAQSVRHKILGDATIVHEKQRSGHLEELVMQLLNQPQVTLEGGPRGQAAHVIRNLFKQAHRASQLVDDSPCNESSDLQFGDGLADPSYPSQGPISELGRPLGREYLLRTFAPSPSPYSRPLPQRLFAVLTRNDFRLAGAFSQDTTFC